MKVKSLSIVESMKLCNLLVAEYAEKALTDDAFAEYASGLIGCSVKASHITIRRKELGIIGTRAARIQAKQAERAAKAAAKAIRKAEDSEKTEDNIRADMFRRILDLERQMAHLLKELGVQE